MTTVIAHINVCFECVCISFLIYWIAMVGIFKTEIANNRLKIRTLAYKKHLNKKRLPTQRETSYYDKVNNFIVTERNYLNPQIDLTLLASKMEISKGYLSKVINDNSGMNFKDYLNHLRVKEAKKILLDPMYNHYTITSIALECGFSSKSSFYKKIIQNHSKSCV